MSLKSLGDLLDTYTDRRYSRNYPDKGQGNEVFDFIKLIQQWSGIVGDHLSKSTSPLKIQSQTLIIITKHAAFAQQLKFMEQDILKKIYQFYPVLEKSIKKISFKATQHFHEIQKNNFEKAKVKSQELKPELHPYNPEYQKLKKEVQKEISNIEDREAKDLLEKIIIQSRL